MDPNQALEDLRKYIQRIYDVADQGMMPGDDALSLAAAADALDEWITNGGFLPTDWDPSKK